MVQRYGGRVQRAWGSGSDWSPTSLVIVCDLHQWGSSVKDSVFHGCSQVRARTWVQNRWFLWKVTLGSQRQVVRQGRREDQQEHATELGLDVGNSGFNPLGTFKGNPVETSPCNRGPRPAASASPWSRLEKQNLVLTQTAWTRICILMRSLGDSKLRGPSVESTSVLSLRKAGGACPSSVKEACTLLHFLA